MSRLIKVQLFLLQPLISRLNEMEFTRDDSIMHEMARELRILGLEKEVNSLYKTLDNYKKMIIDLSQKLEDKKEHA